jgi:hypothetical protein
MFKIEKFMILIPSFLTAKLAKRKKAKDTKKKIITSITSSKKIA